ncbi:MAG: hypothetical protein ACKPKO_44640, partial [Candidatus Fonsibacter sp.]
MDADKDAITKKLLQSRQWGIGVSGGAEAIATAQLLIEDMWVNNVLTKPTAIIQVDQTNCFGQLEHQCIDDAIKQDHPTMAPLTLWKHAHHAQVTQGSAGRSRQTRGAQQGDVAGSFEASVALVEQARDTRA